MKSFLQHIVDDLGVVDGLSLKDKCFVFPSRRAAVYFNDLLQKQFSDSVLWAPSVLSIEEFVQQSTPDLIVIDETNLLFRLFEIYKREEPHIVFDTFYAWGQTLLKDFDEIDRYLVDAELLYKNLQDIENIEESFGPSEEILQAIKGFQEVINTSEETEILKSFKKTWATVGRVYQIFKESLISGGWAYNGLAYRTLAAGLVDGSIEMPYKEIVFSGFNAISVSEQQIIDSLLAAGKGKVYLDADRYYLDDENEEAGYFLRKFRKRWRKNDKVRWVITDGFSNEAKRINILGVSQKTAMAKAAASCVDGDEASTAIALADEALLMPVLYALPEQEIDLNITMGYPVLGTSVANLLKAFIRYHASASVNKKSITYYNKEAYSDLISQSAIRNLVPPAMGRLIYSKSQYMGWQAIEQAIDDANDEFIAVLKQLFSPNADIQKALELISKSILDLYLVTSSDENNESLLEERIIAGIVEYLQSLQGVISQTKLKLSFLTLEKLIGESIKQLSIPFSGEPLANLQVMGFLETRALDFNNLVILSVNEDILPAASSTKTYIPFGIRKAFQLPTFLEHNNIYAYHFFRLLQRATNINLIYNTKLSVTGSGEKSRFILQLINRFGAGNSNIKIEHKLLVPELPDNRQSDESIVIEKTGNVLERLNQHFTAFSDSKPLSPTALVNYITCSLKYYFARISRIREPEEPISDIDARIFGNILHDILETVYTPWIGKEIAKSEIEAILKNQLSKIVDKAFSNYDEDSGVIGFTSHVILHLASRILQNDMLDAPIKIIDLESKLNPLIYDLPLGNDLTIPLGGKIDRLDQILINNEPVVRILDYKTGKFDLKRRKAYNKELSIEDYVAAYFTDPKFKSGFQTYFYILLHKRLFSSLAITGGIIGVKKINAGAEYLRQERGEIENEVIDEFEKKLAELINEIKNPDMPFKQTEDLDNCTYCEFKVMCSR